MGNLALGYSLHPKLVTFVIQISGLVNTSVSVVDNICSSCC